MDKLDIIKLDNGLKIYILNDNNKHTTYINLVVKYGGATNEFKINGKKHKVKNGIAHFIEHLVLESNIYGDIMEMFGKMGIRSNGITSIDRTQYYIDCVDHIYDSLKVLIKGIHSPIINKEVIDKIRLPILEEKRRSLDNKYSMLYNESNFSIMDNQRYNTVLGDLKEIEKINEKEIRTCFDAFYRPENEIIVIGGRFDKEKVVNVIKDTYNMLNFDDIKVEKIIPKHKDKVNYSKKVLNVNTGIDRTLLTFKLNTDKCSAIEKIKLDLYIFSFLRMNFGVMSKLNKTLIEKEIINGGIGFSNSILEDYHVVRIESDTSNGKVFVDYILDYLNSGKFIYDEELFNLYKRNYVMDLITRNDNIYNMIDPLIENIVTFDYEQLDTIEEWEKLNFKDFKKFIKELNFSNYSIIELKPTL